MHQTQTERPSHEPTAPAVWRSGSIVVDFHSREASRDGLPLPLTPMQFKLLQMFVEHPGRFLATRDIIDLVWGRGFYVTERVVYTHINNLRSRLEDDPANPTLIVSRRRIGYMFMG